MSQSETLMLFILGFSVATFLGLIAGRIAWKLAFRLGARHNQRNMPSTMIELQTERDRLRAEHAMMAKKLELRLGDIRMRMAEQTAEVSRHRNRFETLKQDVANRDEMLAEREAEIVTLRDKVSYLESKLEEKEKELADLKDSVVEVEDDDTEEVPAAEATVPVQERLKNRIRDLVSLSKQISKQQTGVPLELEQPVAVAEAGVIVKPADSSTLELLVHSEALEEKIGETERAAEELQEELKRLDQAWSAAAPEAAPEPVTEVPAPAEEEKSKSAITNVISLAQRLRALHTEAKK